jgi:hypothetical protein
MIIKNKKNQPNIPLEIFIYFTKGIKIDRKIEKTNQSNFSVLP